MTYANPKDLRCSVVGDGDCTGRLINGMCVKHYKRQQRTGNVQLVQRVTFVDVEDFDASAPCVECDDPRKAGTSRCGHHLRLHLTKFLRPGSTTLQMMGLTDRQ